MRPLVLICTHERNELTLQNVQLLMEQSSRCDVLVVCSRDDEFDWYSENLPSPVYLAQYLNNPIGAKWQKGVEIARDLQPSHLIILGSDDFIGRDFILNAVNKMEIEDLDFLGLRSFWMFQPQSNDLHLLEYAFPGIPIGGGRVYSLRMLNTLNWKIFSKVKEKHLDDYGWKLAQKSGHKVKLITDIEHYGLNIIAIKSDQKVINKAEAILSRKDRIKIVQHFKNGEKKYSQLLS